MNSEEQVNRVEMKIGEVSVGSLLATHGSPLYVYNQEVIENRCSQLLAALKLLPTKTKAMFACKANTNVAIMKLILSQGVTGIDAVSAEEAKIAIIAGFAPQDVQFTANFVGLNEIQNAINLGVLPCIGELDTLELVGKYLQSQNIKQLKVAVRINPDVGSGECEATITGGPKSKFGIYCNQFEEILRISKQYDIVIDGLHQHIGSNMVQSDFNKYVKSIKKIFEISLSFPAISFINVGGGIGVPYKDEVNPLDLTAAYNAIATEYEQFKSKFGRDVEIRVEPGRFLIAESSYLLAKVTAIKHNSYSTWVGLDTGMNHLIRPALYNSYHKIVNASNLEGEIDGSKKVHICGNICENGDIFGQDRLLTQVQDDDILAIYNAGAYGYSMASNYNSRNRPAEILVSGNSHKVIRRRETLEDQLACQIYE